jgi:hypothetical protein
VWMYFISETPKLEADKNHRSLAWPRPGSRAVRAS